MKIFNWKKDKTTPSSDPYLFERLNADMNYCGLSPELQKGFLFYLGASINIIINETPINLSRYMTTQDLQIESFLKIINAYSQSTGNFSDYGDLNDGVFSEMLYTCNFILYQLSGLDPKDIDKELRSVTIGKSKMAPLLKTDVYEELQKKYASNTYSLNVCHNLIEDIFFKMGKHLNDTEYDLRKSYEAGYAYFCMQTSMDINGTRFLLTMMYKSLSPLYKALINYPILNFAYQNNLMANHIFSSTIQMLYSGIDSKIIQPIHRFHQMVFYVPKTSNFRPEWDFELRNDKEKEAIIFLNALSIRETDIMNLRNDFLDYDNLMCPELKNTVIERNEFYYIIQRGIYKKYNIRPADNDPEFWNNLGDLIQYFGILFYETCLHALVIEELKINK